MAEEENEEATEEGGEESGGGKSPILLIAIVALVSLAIGGGGAYFLFGGQQAPADEEAVEEEVVEETEAEFAERVFALEPFVVNVSGESYPRYLKLTVAFEMSSPEAKMEIEQRVTQVRDSAILLLSSKRLSDVSDFEGKALLKDDIQDRVNSFLDVGRVESVLFTDFVIQ